jgi:hypothetical protein
VLPTLNLTSFSESGPPPTDHIPKHWSFTASKCAHHVYHIDWGGTADARFCPFATNLQVQVLSCPQRDENRQIRIILNDAPVPLSGIRDCGDDEDGLCPLDSFVASVQELVDEVDFEETCTGK